MAKAAKRVDMMLLSANVQVTVPQAVREATPDSLDGEHAHFPYKPFTNFEFTLWGFLHKPTKRCIKENKCSKYTK